MIQRVQSIFILVAILLTFAMLPAAIATFGSKMGLVELWWNSLRDATPGSAIPIIKELPALAFCVLVPLLLNAVGLFLYNHRRLQMRLVGIAGLVELGLCGLLIYVSHEACGAIGAELHFNFRWLLPIAAAVMDFLAYRRIGLDDLLLKSLERLR